MQSTFSDNFGTFLNAFSPLSPGAKKGVLEGTGVLGGPSLDRRNLERDAAGAALANRMESDMLAIAVAIAKDANQEPPVQNLIGVTGLPKPAFLAALTAGENRGLFELSGPDKASLRLTSLGRAFVVE